MDLQANGSLTESIECTCPKCASPILLPADNEGQKVRCLKCRAIFLMNVDHSPPPAPQGFHLDHPILDGFLLGLGMSLAAALVGSILWLLSLVFGVQNSQKNRVAASFEVSRPACCTTLVERFR